MEFQHVALSLRNPAYGLGVQVHFVQRFRVVPVAGEIDHLVVGAKDRLAVQARPVGQLHGHAVVGTASLLGLHHPELVVGHKDISFAIGAQRALVGGRDGLALVAGGLIVHHGHDVERLRLFTGAHAIHHTVPFKGHQAVAPGHRQVAHRRTHKVGQAVGSAVHVHAVDVRGLRRIVHVGGRGLAEAVAAGREFGHGDAVQRRVRSERLPQVLESVVAQRLGLAAAGVVHPELRGRRTLIARANVREAHPVERHVLAIAADLGRAHGHEVAIELHEPARVHI